MKTQYYKVVTKPTEKTISGAALGMVEPIEAIKIPEVEGLNIVQDLNKEILRLRKTIESYTETETPATKAEARDLANQIARRLKIDGWLEVYSNLMFVKLIDTIEAVITGQLPDVQT